MFDKANLITEYAGRPDQYTKGRLGNSAGKRIPVSAGTSWADPDSGFIVNIEPIVHHHNDREI